MHHVLHCTAGGASYLFHVLILLLQITVASCDHWIFEWQIISHVQYQGFWQGLVQYLAVTSSSLIRVYSPLTSHPYRNMIFSVPLVPV